MCMVIFATPNQALVPARSSELATLALVAITTIKTMMIKMR
jgi:hypothetical protein